MTNFEKELIKRFGEQNVRQIEVNSTEMPLLLVTLNFDNQLRILITNGLSDFKMEVPEKVVGREFNEIYFCLPSYWDVNDRENSNMNWIFDWIQRLAKHVVSKNTWFGHGHTIPCGNPFKALSSTMKQNHFFLSDTMLLTDELNPVELEDKTVYLLSIIPIFEEEMDYKQGKGTLKLSQRLMNHGITEKLDDYRGTVLRSKWKFLGK
jgi:hypothetical protein